MVALILALSANADELDFKLSDLDLFLSTPHLNNVLDYNYTGNRVQTL